MNWFNILKEEDSPNSDSLKKKQENRRKLYVEDARLYGLKTGYYDFEFFPGFRFYGALEIFSMLGRKFERRAFKWLADNVFMHSRGITILDKVAEVELKEKPVIQLNPILRGGSSLNTEGDLIYELSFAGPNMEVERNHIDIPVEEFMHIYPSGYKGYKINDTVEKGDYKRLLNYLLENMEGDLSAVEVPLEMLPKTTQKYAKYRNASSIYVKIKKRTQVGDRSDFVDKWEKMLKGGFRF